MCYNPIRLKSSGNQPVPCGKCELCRNRRAQSWAIRLQQELKIATNAHFITLTFDEEQLPRNKDTGYPTLDKSILQAFIKRLRKYGRKNTAKLRYYAVGEYGHETERPHYHLIIFNAKVKDIEKAWAYEESKKAEANRTRALRKRKRSIDSLHT